MIFEVPFIRPEFPSVEALSTDIAEIVASNWYTNFGPKEREFSRAVADYVGRDSTAVSFSNATIGLMAAITCLLGRGDGTRCIIVPSFTFAAGPEAIEWCGYKPLFIDVVLSTLQPSLSEATEALESFGEDVAGILLCNTFGIGNTEIDEWESLARGRVPLIVDSAAGFGSVYSAGRPLGSAGDCEVFSFHATKPFAIGEGGAVLARDQDLALRLREFTNFGFRDGMGAVGLGLNGKLQEISAAIGLRQLVPFADVLQKRRGMLDYYKAELASLEIQFPENIENSSVCFATMLLADSTVRDATRSMLMAKGIEARTYYSPPVHRQPHFAAERRVGTLNVTEDVVARILSVPVYQGMSDRHIKLILDTIKEGTH